MYAEISLLSMSNSKIFLDDDEEGQGIQFDIMKRPVLEFQEERGSNQATANSSHNRDEERDAVEDKEEKNGREYQCDVTASKENETETETEKKKKKKRPCLGEFKATDYDDDEEEDDDDDDDGFKTPTSLDHKIPVMKQCPPAPRKPKPCFLSSKKRKASPTQRRSLQLDFSQEAESWFPKPLPEDLRRIKKVRTEDSKQ